MRYYIRVQSMTTLQPLAVTSGLALYWDIANHNSYPGSGTDVYDLSCNGHHATLANGVGFDGADGGGALVFDGVNDYAVSTTPDLRTADTTIIGVSRYVSVDMSADNY